MWKVYILNNYLFIENDVKQHRRTKCKVTVSKDGATLQFYDKKSFYFESSLSKLTDKDGNPFTSGSFDEFITLNTGE